MATLRFVKTAVPIAWLRALISAVCTPHASTSAQSTIALAVSALHLAIA